MEKAFLTATCECSHCGLTVLIELAVSLLNENSAGKTHEQRDPQPWLCVELPVLLTMES